jgi:hypothetical protein
MKKYIIADCNFGFGNRLKCLISAMRLAEKCSKSLVLCWHRNSHVNCNFSDLFENKIPEITPSDLDEIKKNKNRDEKYEIENSWRLAILPEDDLPSNFSRVYYSRTGTNVDCEYDRIPIAVREKILVYVNRLNPKLDVLEKVENFAKNFNKDTVSVSIRSWIECPARANLFDLNNVYTILDKIDSSNFFVSCDSQEIIEKLISKYGEKVLLYPKTTYAGDRDSSDSMKDVLCDLLLLSKNKRLVASYLSTFPEVAWWFGGCEAKVTIIPPKIYPFKLIIDEPNNLVVCVIWRWCKSIQPYYVIRFYNLFKRLFAYIQKMFKMVSSRE